jgi:uncharacterized protein
MSFSPALRSLVVGVVAAVIVVAAYAWGHGGRAAAAAPAPASAAAATLTAVSSPDPAAGISVSGTGRATGTPDLLRMDLSIDVVKPDVATALQAANVAADAVQKAAKAAGVADADIQTSGLSIQPHFTYSNNSSQQDGYAVSEGMSVVLRGDLVKAGATISSIAKVGGDNVRIGGVSLDINDDSSLLADARQKAFKAAEAKAKAYASAAGRTLGAVTSISETDNSGSQPYPMAARSAAAASDVAPVPVAAGSQDVSVTVSATWALA